MQDKVGRGVSSESAPQQVVARGEDRVQEPEAKSHWADIGSISLCPAIKYLSAIRSIPKKLKMEMTGTQRCVGNRELRSGRYNGVCQMISRYSNSSVQLAAKFFSKVRAEPMPTTKRVLQKYCLKPLVCRPPSLSFELSS